MKKKRIKYVFIALIVAIVSICFYEVHISYNNLTTTNYTISSNKINNDVNMVILSDLHENNFGENNKELINSIKKHGPYIVIAPKIAIPHAQEGHGVNETAICFMKTNTPVSFGEGEEYDAQLFFVLASIDNEVHLKNLTKMVELISDEETVEKLLEAQSVEDLKKLV